jgi:hypothetical protein
MARYPARLSAPSATSHAARLHHLGARSVSRSTPADAKRPAAVLTELPGPMLGRAGRGLRRQVGEALRLPTNEFEAPAADIAAVHS